MTTAGRGFSRLATQSLRRHLVGRDQRWEFAAPDPGWRPPHLERTSLYLHVPFCRNSCPYCPYTKIAYHDSFVEPYTIAALAEVDRWAETTGSPEITSVYVGGGTPTLALGSVSRILDRVRERFRLTGEVCIETSPCEVTRRTVEEMQDAGITLVSLGVQSFRQASLDLIGRRYSPVSAERALSLLTRSGFASVNADIMFALPC